MNVQIGTRLDVAPSGWYFKTKLRISFSYFHHLMLNAAVLLTADVIGLVLAFEIAACARWMIMGQPMSPAWVLWLCGFWGMGASMWRLLPGWGLSPVEALRRQVGMTCAVFALAAAALFLSKSGVEHSRFTFLLAFVLAIPLVPFMRMLGKRVLIKNKLWGIPVAIYGGGVAGRSIIQRLKDEPGQGYYPVCVFDDNPEVVSAGNVEGVPVCGNTESIAQNVPMAILAITRIEGERITEMMEGPLSSYLKVMIIPNLIHTPWLWAVSRDLSGTPGLEMTNNLLNPGKRMLKRAFEIGVTVAALPVWGMLFGFIYWLIRLDGQGDPIFKQARIGQGGSAFETWKFRTMVPNAEEVLGRELAKDPELRAEWEQNCKLENDPRITKLGRLLRKTSMDEIPQLINVLRGEMSLIGPRPLPTYHHEQLPAAVRKLRERVRPGMTGLWQISGRSDAGNEGMARWDPLLCPQLVALARHRDLGSDGACRPFRNRGAVRDAIRGSWFYSDRGWSREGFFF